MKATLERFKNVQVYVGIPERTAGRPGSGHMNNAALMYVHTHGSPLINEPPRPVIEPAIEASPTKELIVKELGAASKAVLAGQEAQAFDHLDKAGTIGANAAKRWFFDPRNRWAPNAPSTIRRKGSSRPLIDTGEMRRAITYVVKK